MSREDPIQVRGVVVAVLPELRYRVELANGHQLTGYVPVKHRQWAPGLQVGDAVDLEMSAFDFSKGRICFGKR